MLDPTSRLTFMSGVSNGTFQIPNNPGQTPNFTAFGVSKFDSTFLNEHQNEFNQFNVVAYQKSAEDIDYQVSYFNRYSQLHFYPDPIGDLVFNGVSSDVYRQSVVNGIQEDTAWRVGYCPYAALRIFRQRGALPGHQHIHRVAGRSRDRQSDRPVTGDPIDPPFSIFDSSPKTGWLIGTYLQDEWRITNQLTLNAGLRFDQMYQYVDANQLSPRVSLTWKPYDGTTFHVGYARNFTPPQQVIAAPTNLALVRRQPPPPTRRQPEVPINSPVLPERSHVFDVGVVQKIYPIPGLEVGVDGYYKIARDLLDDGQFGAAYVLNGFNYERGENIGPRTQVDLHQRQLPRLRKPRLGEADRHQHRIEPVSVRAGRTGLYRHPLYLHRPCPGPDRVGRRLLSVERHALQRLDDLRQRTSLRLRQYRSPAVLYPGQCRGVARLQHRRAEQADHGALRRRQPVRQDLRDQGRLGHRRVRPAIRTASRVLCRHFAETLKCEAGGRINHRREEPHVA